MGALPEYSPEEIRRRYGSLLSGQPMPEPAGPLALRAPPPPPVLPPPDMAPPAPPDDRIPMGFGLAAKPPAPPSAGPSIAELWAGQPKAPSAPEPTTAPEPEEMPPAPPPASTTPAPKADEAQSQKPYSIYDDPQFAGYMAEQAGPKPNKTARIFDALFSGLAGQNYDSGYWQAKDQAAQQEDLKNPNSAQSQMLRKANAPLLKELGFQDDEIAHLSGADIQGMTKGGNLIEGAMRARQSAANAKAAEAKLKETRAYEEQKAAAKAKADQEEWDRRNAVTAPQALQRAETMAGIGAQNSANQAALTSGLAMNRELTMNAISDQQRQEAEKRAEERRIADEKRKAEMEKAKVESGYVSPEEIEASNVHIKVTNPKLLHETQATSKRQVGDIRNDIKTAERAGHMLDQMLADEAEWSKGSVNAKAQAVAGAPLTDEAKRLAEVKARYEAFSSELQGIKAKIAQSAGSAAEREDAKHEIPSIMSPSARQKLQGIGGMLESNANANLGATGMVVKFGKGGGHGAAAGGGSKLTLPDGSRAADTPANRKKLEAAGIKYEVSQ